MKHFLLCLLAFISYDLYSAAPAGVSGRVVAEHFSPVASRAQIHRDAKARLKLLLDHEEDGLHAKLQKLVTSSSSSSMQSDTQSLQQEQDRFRLKRAEFEQESKKAREDLVRKAIIVLKDFNVDAGGGVYERYLTHEYADAIDQRVKKEFDGLREIEDAALQAALNREQVQVYVASRPFQLGSSLFTNIVQDVREDLPKVLPVAGACAVALPYAPVKTREKVEEALGVAMVKHPKATVGSLAAIIAGWQAYKYLSRYVVYKEKFSNLQAQKKSDLCASAVSNDTAKQLFIAQVPFILQSARESATIARLDNQVQGLSSNSVLMQQELLRLSQLVEGQSLSLQSLQTFAQAHGASLEDVRKILREIRSGQATYARGLLLMGKSVSEQQAALDAVAFDTQATREGVQAILRAVTRDDDGSQAAREHRSASDVACSRGESVAGFAAVGHGMASPSNRVPSLGKRCRGLGVGPGSVYSASRAGGQASSAPDASESVKLQ